MKALTYRHLLLFWDEIKKRLAPKNKINEINLDLEQNFIQINEMKDTIQSYSSTIELLQNHVDEFLAGIDVQDLSFNEVDNELILTQNDGTTFIIPVQKKLCCVKFYNESSLLDTQYVEYGETVIYSGSTPTKSSTDYYNYSFSGWDSSLENITEDKNVYAQFNASTRYYTVNFYNGTSLLQSKSVTYGSSVSYTGSTPTKSSTAQYTYSFSGWSSTNGGSVSSTILNEITEDKNVYAVFSASVRYYNVYFYNGSTLLQTKSVAYGSNATYTGTTPTKASTNTLKYTFKGWASSSTGTASSTILNNITANKTVYAVFTSSTRTYTISYVLASKPTNASWIGSWYAGSSAGTPDEISYPHKMNIQYCEYGAVPPNWASASGYMWIDKSGTKRNFIWTPTKTAVTGNTTYYVKMNGSQIALS